MELRKRQTALIILLLLLGASALRIPNLFDNLGFHPDERGMVMISQSISWSNLKPESFHYGSFNFYLVFFVSQCAAMFDRHLAGYDGIFYVGRTIAMLASVLAILGTYYLSLAVFRRRNEAIAAAFILSCMPLHLQLSRFFTVDILLTTLCTWILVLSCSLFRRRTTFRLCAIGLLCAAAVTTKVSALSIGLPVLVSVYLASSLSPRPFVLRGFFGSLMLIGLVFIVATVLFEPYLLLDPLQVYADNMRQITMVRGEWRAPYTLQYEGTVPYLYHLEQMLWYAIGLPCCILIVLGLLHTCRNVLRGSFGPDSICLIWVLVVFLSVAGLYVKFPRYLLPIYPALAVFASHGLTRLSSVLGRYSAAAAKGLAAAFILLIVLRAFAWFHMFRQPHNWLEASRWIYEHFEKGSSIVEVHWDDSLPKSMRGKGRSAYTFATLALYEKDTPEKYRTVCGQLETANYLILPTTRFYGAMQRVWKEYPYSALFLSRLFSGELGWHIKKEFYRFPQLAGLLAYPDHLADESLRVYDHPRVLIFENTEAIGAERCLQMLKDAEDASTLERPDFGSFFGEAPGI